MDVEAFGRAFVDALAGRDFPALRAALSDDVRFRLLVPKGPQEEAGVAATVGRFTDWFADADPVVLESCGVGDVAGRAAISYRFQLKKPEGWRVLEQHLMADVDESGRSTAIDLLCSGFRAPLEPVETGAHHVDAGDLGCADGPAAKEDLPSLARMMGHAVRSIETSGDGGLLISVERGR
jgi:hypothetical protein